MVGDEETFEEQDRGPVTYQESKEFNGQLHIISARDNAEARKVTFEIFGLDTNEILHLQYTYVEFDALFRFNAELMNPNRKEGRFHYVMQRLSLADNGNGGWRLILDEEPTEDAKPQMPVYDKLRKIPTGRMNYEERKRLRESMDTLNAKRADCIARRNAERNVRFMAHIEYIKEQARELEAERKVAIEEQRKETLIAKDRRAEEERKRIEQEIKMRAERVERVEAKEERTEEQDAQEIKEMHARYKAREDAKRQALEEWRRGRKAEKEKKRLVKEARERDQIEAAANREIVWKERDARIAKKALLYAKRIIASKDDGKKAEAMAERKATILAKQREERIEVFAEQLERSRLRQEAAEKEAAWYREQEELRRIPDRKERAAEARASTSRTSDSKKGGKQSKKSEAKEEAKEDKPVDAVEQRMREKLMQEKHNQYLEEKRQNFAADQDSKRNAREAALAKERKDAERLAAQQRLRDEQEKQVILQQKLQDERELKEQRANREVAMQRLREENIARKAKKGAQAGPGASPQKPDAAAPPPALPAAPPAAPPDNVDADPEGGGDGDAA